MFPRKLVAFFLLSGLIWIQSCKSREKAVPQQKKEMITQKKKRKPSAAKKSSSKPKEELCMLLGLSEKEIRKSSLYSFVADWYGVPYKYGGCKKSGVDCSCFANILYEEVYHKSLSGTAADMYKQSEKITLEKAHEGDLVFFKINVPYVSHVGVLLRNGNFVHASTSKGVVVSKLSEAYYKKYFHSAGRMKDS